MSQPVIEVLETRTLLSSSVGIRAAQAAPEDLVVMSQNLYLGADLAPLATAPSVFDLPPRVRMVWGQVKKSNFRQRAKEIAAEIASARPALVALQEASIFRQQTPGDTLSAQPTPATHVVFDYVRRLLHELNAIGQHYQVVAEDIAADLELPDDRGNDIRYTDRNVILARTEVLGHELKIIRARSGDFSTNLTIGAGLGASVTVIRGWATIDAKWRGQRFRLVNTHLEIETSPAIQEAQGAELLVRPAKTTMPTILIGDFNSAGDDSTTATHQNILAGGFSDAWQLIHPDLPGYTSGQAADLRNPVSSLSERIDQVLLRGDISAQSIKVIGDKPANRTASALWPSDHAGVLARLRFA